MSFSKVQYTVPVASSAPSRSKQGYVYTTEDISTYGMDQEKKIEGYAGLGMEKPMVVSNEPISVEESPTVVANEAISIQGMVVVPAATDYTESKKSLNEISTERGEMASVPEIDICGFMSSLPDLDLGLPEGDSILPTIEDIVAKINGITLSVLTVATDAVNDIVGKVQDTVEDIGQGVGSGIPKVTCGKKPPVTEEPVGMDEIGAALAPPPVEQPVTVEPPPYGTDPVIVIESPEVTVQSLDDQIDLGEF